MNTAQNTAQNQTTAQTVTCPQCEGTGRFLPFGEKQNTAQKVTCPLCNGQGTLVLTGLELAEHHVKTALYKLRNGKNAKPDWIFMQRELVLSVFEGNYGPAGVVLAVNGSPPRALSIITKEGWLWTLCPGRSPKFVDPNFSSKWHTECWKHITKYLRLRTDLPTALR